MLESPHNGTAVHNPDLNWSQVQETILMLGIVVAQVRHAMQDSGASLNTLSESFQTTATHIESLRDALLEVGQQLPAELAIESKVEEIQQQNVRSVMAFQFFDRLSQRMDHVCGTISALAELVSDRQAMFLPHEWHRLQQRIRSQYTMEQEKQLFDAILQGMPIAEAITLAGNVQLAESKPLAGDIELF
ncbi:MULTISPECIES: hypothetical protein [Chitinibacter]|uniref:hypothetical protein n=1 Tax=Chitinibacter TaxID=230666 RepID=UPI000413A052|nr:MULTISPECIES: hypothetical protein [Chitinibacter]